MTGSTLTVRGLTVRYGSTTALQDVDLDVRAGTLTGLLGRNGSGKTTLLSVAAAFRRPTAGQVLVDGEDPWENERIAPHVHLVRESGDVLVAERLSATLRMVADARPDFSHELAGTLLDTFELDVRTRPDKLSRGKRSAFGIVLGLASRARLTLLDEVHLGLDAPSRYAFYDALVADYVEHPRTIVLSSHLIAEIDRLLEDVVVLDRGRLLLAEDAETLRGHGLSVTGPADAVERFVAGRTVLGRQRLGGTAQATLLGPPDEAEAEQARDAGLELGPVPLQDLFVHLTADGAPAFTGAARRTAHDAPPPARPDGDRPDPRPTDALPAGTRATSDQEA
ncbi:ATP-binding cassette domain-containing protein [Cellulomonas soli]|uniref:ABC transporter n=1 Tax=Cellulomonas soli TaxID=931535 RepID=A0A512PHP2_9CELL|nr:ABC transporter ATP-binding protein [Cellulomonas soli]NYI59232.1 ABC-2 type transport system ATP-binding protein [Cellulomonas soli]GEP70738.1 ABC transporter [Cellulomonas soli]